MSNKNIVIVLMLAAALFMPSVSSGEAKKPKNPENVVSTAIYEGNQIAKNLLEVADRMMLNGDRSAAIETYQQALEDTLDHSPNALIDIKESVKEKLIHSRPCLSLIRNRMMQMNAAEIVIYRDKYEYATERMVKEAIKNRNMAAMLDISRRRPYTMAGIHAAAISASVAMESGKYSLAASISRSALETIYNHPDVFGNTGPARAALYAKAAEAHYASENKEGFDWIVSAVAKNKALGAEKIAVDGKPTTLAAYVEKIAKTFKVTKTPLTPGYPMLGGGNTRAVMMDGYGEIGREKWRYAVDYKDRDYYGRVEKIESDIIISPVPTASGDRIYLNTGHGMVAVSEYNGIEVFGNSLSNPAQARVLLLLQESLDSCTVRENLVYFVETTGSTNLETAHSQKLKFPHFRRLVAVDTKTGKRVWDTDNTTKLDKADLVCGSPAVYRDTILFQVMRHTKISASYYMVCTDAQTGELRWRLPLVSKVAGEAAYNYRRRSPNMIAIKGDLAIATSSAGVVTAVDITNRTIKWGVKFHYDEAAHRGDERTGDYRLESMPGCTNQPMLVGDNVILKPGESNRIYCLDVNTGEWRWSVEHPTISYIAGFDGDSLFVVGPGVKEVSIKDGTILFNEDFKTGVKSYRDVFLLAGTQGHGGIMGRPALTKDAIYISTKEALFRFDRKTNKIKKLFDWADHDLLPGNLLMTENGFYVANCDGITAFYTPAAIDIMTKLLEKNPDDPASLYRRGMTYLRFDQTEKAFKDLDLAEKNAAPQQMLSGQLLRSLIRAGLLEHGLLQAKKDSAQGEHESAVHWATRAIDYASKPAEKSRALCVLGDVQEFAGKAFIPAAVESWQRIIVEHPGELAAFGENFQRAASLHASEKIEASIKKYGRSVYAAVEKRATAELAAAKTPAEFQKVLDQYPNSFAAFGAIEQFADKSDGIKMSLMTKMIERCEISAQTAPFFARFYRLAWVCGEADRARTVLERLARLPDGVKIVENGAEMSAHDFVKAHMGELNATKANDPAKARFDANATYDEKVLKRFPVLTERSRQQVNFLTSIGSRPAIMKDRLLIKCAGYIYCADTNTGHVLWQNPGVLRMWLGMSVKVVKGGGTLEIDEMFSGSEAEKSGLKVGDRIVSMNTQPAVSLDVWRSVIDGSKTGAKIEVEYTRKGKKSVASVLVTMLPLRLLDKRGPRNSAHMGRYVGSNRMMLVSPFSNASARCIDLETGRTLWEVSGLVNRIHDVNAGGLMRNGLFASCKAIRSGSRVIETRISAIDFATGKVVAQLKLDGAVDQYALAGDVWLVRQGPTCTAYGLLSGKKCYEFKLRRIFERMSNTEFVNNFHVAADRIMVYADLNDKLRSIDLWNGTNICEPVKILGCKIIYTYSDRYLMAHADRSACRSAHIFDGIAATGETDIKFSFDKPLENLRIVGARVFAEVSRSGPKYFWSYNIKTRVVSESVTKQSNKNQFYDFKYFAGEYVILGKMHSVAAGKSSTKYEIHVIVFDPTGKEYFSFSAPAQDSVRIEFLVIDGRLFIIAGHQLYVFKSAK